MTEGTPAAKADGSTTRGWGKWACEKGRVKRSARGKGWGGEGKRTKRGKKKQEREKVLQQWGGTTRSGDILRDKHEAANKTREGQDKVITGRRKLK